MRGNTRWQGTHGNNDNVMLKVLDTANPIRSDRFFIHSNKEQRSCTMIIIGSIRIKEDNIIIHTCPGFTVC